MGTGKVTIDILAYDPSADEYVVYFIECGPWAVNEIPNRLCILQQKLFDSVDVIVDGMLAKRFPESHNKKIRIQVDLHDNAPEQFESLIVKFREYCSGKNEYQKAIASSPYISSLRIVSGHEMGR